MQLTPWQITLRDRTLALLREAGVEEPKVKKKVTHFDDEEEVESEVEEKQGQGTGHGDGEASLVLSFRIEGDTYEVWLYPEEAGILEPGDDWWPFDREEFDSPEALAEAVLAHVRDIAVDVAAGD